MTTEDPSFMKAQQLWLSLRPVYSHDKCVELIQYALKQARREGFEAGRRLEWPEFCEIEKAAIEDMSDRKSSAFISGIEWLKEWLSK